MAVTNVSTPLPDLSLEEEAVLTVTSGDPGAIITQLVIHFTQDVPALPVVLEPHLLAYAEWSTPAEPAA